MQKIHESPFYTVYWHEKPTCLQFISHETTKTMLPDEYMKELETCIELTKQYKPENIYADSRNFYFTISPEIQEYINNNIFNVFLTQGVKKHAILVSKDLFAMVSFEQAVDDNEQIGYLTRYFNSTEEVEKWLGLDMNSEAV